MTVLTNKSDRHTYHPLFLIFNSLNMRLKTHDCVEVRADASSRVGLSVEDYLSRIVDNRCTDDYRLVSLSASVQDLCDDSNMGTQLFFTHYTPLRHRRGLGHACWLPLLSDTYGLCLEIAVCLSCDSTVAA